MSNVHITIKELIVRYETLKLLGEELLHYHKTGELPEEVGSVDQLYAELERELDLKKE